MEVNGIRGIIKPQRIVTIVPYLKYNSGKIHYTNFINVYYFPGAPKLLIRPQKCTQDRGEAKVGR